LQVFWAGMQAGDFITDAVAPINTSRRTGRRVLLEAGGVRPRRGRDLKGRCLTFGQREEIAVLRAQGRSLREIGTVIGRSASTVSRELRRNTRAGSVYRATSAHALAYERASRPKPAKLHTNTVLRAKVEEDLKKKYSPEQIAGRLRVEFPDEPEMRVSPETIYQSLYVQSRGALKRDLAACLRTGRAMRQACRKAGQRKNRIPGMINISERPPEVQDRGRAGALGISMFLSSRLGGDAWDWFPVDGVVAEHGPEDVDAASGECDEGLFMGFSFSALPVVIDS
jgi:transposase, IS30 family